MYINMCVPLSSTNYSGRFFLHFLHFLHHKMYWYKNNQYLSHGEIKYKVSCSHDEADQAFLHPSMLAAVWWGRFRWLTNKSRAFSWICRFDKDSVIPKRSFIFCKIKKLRARITHNDLWKWDSLKLSATSIILKRASQNAIVNKKELSSHPHIHTNARTHTHKCTLIHTNAHTYTHTH